jgi:hypothetical protein
MTGVSVRCRFMSGITEKPTSEVRILGDFNAATDSYLRFIMLFMCIPVRGRSPSPEVVKSEGWTGSQKTEKKLPTVA